MQYSRWYFVALAFAVSGCTSEPDAVEKRVRAIISDHFKVDSSTVRMNKPISDPPLKADDLDLVEIVMELEERLGVIITDEAVERYAGGKLGKGPIRITPNQLVSIVREAPKLQREKKKK